MSALVKLFANVLHHRPVNSSTEIRLTRLCTQRCRQCRVYERDTQPASMSLELFQIISQRLREYGAWLGFISGGEALLAPDLLPILAEAKKTFRAATTLVTGLYHQRQRVLAAAEFCLANDINIQTSMDGFGAVGDYLRGVDHFSDTVLEHMRLISAMKKNSKALLYANIVLNNLNLDQVPELIRRCRGLGWRTTIGLYHHLTETTRSDDDLRIVPDERLDRLLAFLDHNPDILNLNSFIRGIAPFLRTGETTRCPFVAGRTWMTRTTIMENGDLHLCWGGPAGNLYASSMQDLFSAPTYQERLAAYDRCAGCWTTCYTQRHLLLHPRSPAELCDNIVKMVRLRRHQRESLR
jgi:MoaA/NifB/PqqE/SkfB family radical SAM enzyme